MLKIIKKQDPKIYSDAKKLIDSFDQFIDLGDPGLLWTILKKIKTVTM